MKNKDLNFQKYSVGIIIILILGMIFGLVVLSEHKIADTPGGIVYKFLTAKSVDERKLYVLEDDFDSEYVKNGMSEYIKKTLGINEINYDDFTYEEDYNKEKLKNGDTTRVKLYLPDKNGLNEDKIVIMYLKKTEDSYKMDFKPFQNIQGEYIAKILRNEDVNVNECKVYIQLDPYNNQLMNIEKKKEYKDVINEYFSFIIMEPETKFMVRGFMKKGTKQADYLASYSTNGKKQVTIKCRYDDSSNEYSEGLIINDVTSFTWADGDRDFDMRDF